MNFIIFFSLALFACCKEENFLMKHWNDSIIWFEVWFDCRRSDSFFFFPNVIHICDDVMYSYLWQAIFHIYVNNKQFRYTYTNFNIFTKLKFIHWIERHENMLSAHFKLFIHNSHKNETKQFSKLKIEC